MATRATRSSAGTAGGASPAKSPMASPMASPTRKAAKDAKEGSSSPERAVSPKKKGKDSFQWSTPADEFADDVNSDDEGEYLVDEDGDETTTVVVEELVEGEVAADEEGGVVIHLAAEEAEKYGMRSKDGGGVIIKGETNEDIQRFLENYGKHHRGEIIKAKKPKQKFQCPKCDKVWNWPWELRRHVMTHYKEKEREQTTTYKCEECGRGFQWKRDLAQHRRLHTGEKLLVCSVCNKKFTTRQMLLHHVVVHTGEKPFQCAICGNRFTQPANLRTHMKKKHNDSVIKNNKCPHCQDNFPSIIAVHQHILEDHQNIVAEEREEQDTERVRKDQERVEREKQREDNRRKRSEKRKDKIDYNDFRHTKGLHEWEINYEFHIGEGLVRGVDWDRTPSNGDLSCDICDRKFEWRYELMFHGLCHQTDEMGQPRNRVCPECDTAFKVPIGLKHHLLIHTGELPFLCLHCWRSFSSHIDLKLHIRKEHLFHLEPEKAMPTTPASRRASMAASKIKQEKADAASASTPKRQRRSVKLETPPAQQQQLQQQQTTTAIMQTTNERGETENVELVMANQTDENGETQTILVNQDGTIVHTGNQDMIVVIQSDDFDQSQGLIVVDPSQLQQVVGADGVPMTVMQAQDGHQQIILSDGDSKVIQVSEEQQQYHQHGEEVTESITFSVTENGQVEQITEDNSPEAAAAVAAVAAQAEANAAAEAAAEGKEPEQILPTNGEESKTAVKKMVQAPDKTVAAQE